MFFLDIRKRTYFKVGKMLAYFIMHGYIRHLFFSEAFYKMLIMSEAEPNDDNMEPRHIIQINKVVIMIKYRHV